MSSSPSLPSGSILSSETRFRKEFWKSCEAMSVEMRERFLTDRRSGDELMFPFRLDSQGKAEISGESRAAVDQVNQILACARSALCDSIRDKATNFQLTRWEKKGTIHIGTVLDDPNAGRLETTIAKQAESALGYFLRRFDIQSEKPVSYVLKSSRRNRESTVERLSFVWENTKIPAFPNPLKNECSPPFIQEEVYYTDLIVIAGKTEFRGTLAELALQSRFFAEILRNRTEVPEIVRTDATPKIVEKAMSQIKLSEERTKTIIGLLRLGFEWQMPDLQNRCAAELVDRKKYRKIEEIKDDLPHPLLVKTAKANQRRLKTIR